MLCQVLPTNAMVPAYLRVRTMGASLMDVTPELVQLISLMCIYFCTASLALYYQRKKRLKIYTPE